MRILRPLATTTRLALPLLVAASASSGLAEPARIAPAVRATLSAPLLTRPIDERRFDFEEPASGVAPVAWDACQGAAFYQVQVSATEDFAKLANPSHELVLGEPPNRVELVGLPAGGYYLRVAAIDREGRRGPWSRVRRFSVNQGAPPPTAEGPPLSITEAVAAGDMLIVHGKAPSGVRVEATVNGVAAGEITVGDEGEFSIMVEANAIGRNAVVLLATDKSGRSSTSETSFHYGGG